MRLSPARRSGPRDVLARFGFTLVELLMAVAAVAILAAIAIPQYSQYQYNAQVAVAVRDLGALEFDIDRYYTLNNQYPAALADLGMNPAAFVDPWGFPYQYLNHAGVNGKGSFRKDRNLNPLNSDYDLYSLGRDGVTKMQITQKEALDDVIRAGNGGYLGLASAF
jgi:general secretion pathway protein G